ncbi:hypothetical protein B4Q13_17640 [Lacticaseibacillus rhamnosus]
MQDLLEVADDLAARRTMRGWRPGASAVSAPPLPRRMNKGRSSSASGKNGRGLAKDLTET